MKFPFIDLQAQRAHIAPQIDAAIAAVLEHGQFILGPEVTQFEDRLAAFEADTVEGEAHCVSCANGTDALKLPLLAWGIGAGDIVFCPSWSYAASAEAIAIMGATPYFVDIDRDSYLMCPDSLKAAIIDVRASNIGTARAIIAVDIFGRPADYPVLRQIADEFGLKLIADSAQAMGCRLDGKAPLIWADVVTTSFFPAKPLGCYGDGGAILTQDNEFARRLRSLRFHGRAKAAGDHSSIGLNSRLDTIQAAILIEKLKVFDDEIHQRDEVSQRYNVALRPHVLRVPDIGENIRSTWAQYCLEVENRDAVLEAMRAAEIPVAAYYPLPIHMQTAYKDYPVSPDGLPNTMAAKDVIMALPMHAYLSSENQDEVISTLLSIL